MIKPLDDEFQDRPEFPHPSDTILIALLGSFFEKEEAPDLRSRIHSSLNKASVPSPRCTTEEYDEAMQMAASDINDGYGSVIPPPIERSGAVYDTDSEDFTPWLRRGFYLVAALAAAVIGALLLPNSVKTWVQPENTKATAPDLASSAPASQRKLPDSKGGLATASSSEQNIESVVVSPTREATESIAAQFKTAESSIAPPRSSSLSSTGVSAESMNNQEIVGVIDSQLSFLWDRVGLTTTQNIQVDSWLDRAADAIIGRPATNAEKQVFHSGKNEDRIARYVDSLIASSEFSRFWSLRLAEHYLGRKRLQTRDLSGAESAFIEWLQESLAQKRFVGDIEQQLIDGPSQTADKSVRSDPASLWFTEVMEKTSNNHLETLDQLVPPLKRRSPRDESLIGVSRHLMRIAGNPAMVCSQCHVDEAARSDMKNYISMSSEQVAVGDKSFWSVPANFSGVTIVHQNVEHTLRTGPPVEYYYEDGEGRMKLAPSGPPSLRKDDLANKSLGEWFSKSSEPRRAIIELVWGQIFKQPLLPAIGLSEEEGLSERDDLRELLANQMQLRKADLGTLVRWIVFAKSFRLEGLKTDAPWYIKSTEPQIAESQRKMRLFGGFSGYESGNAESGKMLPSKIATWLDQKRSFQKAESATLAQPGTEKKPAVTPKSTKNETSEDQVRFFISVEQPYSQLKLLSQRLANSSMSWQMLLEHAYLATDTRFPTKVERDEANKLFESTGRDRAKAFVVIVNGRFGSW